MRGYSKNNASIIAKVFVQSTCTFHLEITTSEILNESTVNCNMMNGMIKVMNLTK